MSQERDFHNFELKVDRVYDLGGAVLPEIAELVGVNIGETHNEEGLVALWNELGPNPELRKNPDNPNIEREVAADLVERSGIMLPLDRSISSPVYEVQDFEVPNIVMTGGVWGWMRRSAKVATELSPRHVIIGAGDRIMKGPTEKDQPDVAAVFEETGNYPTEQQYMREVIAPELVEAGHTVSISEFTKMNGDQIAAGIVEKHPELLEERFVAIRVPNAAVQLGAQIELAIRAQNSVYNSDSHDPRSFVMSDTLPVARTEEQDADPTNYQKAQTALRQVAVTGLMLHKLKPMP